MPDLTDLTQLLALANAHPRAAGAELKQAIELREHVYDALFGSDDRATQALADAYRDPVAHAHLAPRAPAGSGPIMGSP